MRWTYLSPHYDDAIFSCGGLISRQAAAGDRVEILTVCGGAPPSGRLSPFAGELHRRWGMGLEVAESRRAEDARACAAAGAVQDCLPIPDCIYRLNPDTGEPLISKNEDLFMPSPPRETPVLERILAKLAALPAEAGLVCPLAVGGHIDHRLVRQAALLSGRPLWFYADFPYAGRENADVAACLPSGAEPTRIELGPDALEKWVEASACYQSQISTFWKSRAELGEAIHHYYHSNPAGHTLWYLPG